MHNLQADLTGYRLMLGRAQHSAFGWECQGIYRDHIPDDWSLLPASIRVHRVWTLADPMTASQCRQLDLVPRQVARGERVGVLNEEQALALDLPDHDFWIIDDEYVVSVDYRDHRCVGATADADPAVVDRYRRWRDLACTHAVASIPEQRAG